MNAGAVVKLGSTGITIWGDRYDGPGKFYFRDFNWGDMPGVKADDVERPMADGNFPGVSYLDARNLDMDGFLVATSHEKLVHQINRLKAQRGRTVRVTVEEPGLTTWADAEIRAVRVSLFGFAAEAHFEIQFHMPDPRKIGSPDELAPFGSGVQAFHRGNYASTPNVTVTGVMPSGYRINGPDGMFYQVTQALAAGQTHRIDFETGFLYRNDVLQQGAVSRAEVWTIPPGLGVVMTLVPVSGSGTLAVTPPYTSI